MSSYSFEQNYIQLDLFDEHRNVNRSDIVEEYITAIKTNRATVVFDTNHLAHLVGYSEHFLHSISAIPENFYRRYRIPKKSGGTRIIHEPLPTLKEIQRTIVDRLLSNVDLHKAARAFRKNHTLRGGAIIHRGRPFMLNLDIENFFSCITSYNIYKVFFDIGYTRQIARLLSGICTQGNCLPQGSPTSPILSNIYMIPFDRKVFEYCNENSINYTRYADDMTFSAMDDRLLPLLSFVRDELRTLGLSLNKRKTKYVGKGGRKYVNGIVVHQKLNVLKSLRSELRQSMYYIKKYGINGHIRKSGIETPNYIDSLIGKLNYVLFVTRDERYRFDIDYLKKVKALL